MLLSNLRTFVNKGKVLAPNEVNNGNVTDLIPSRLGFAAFHVHHIGSARVLHVCGGVAEMCITIRGGCRGVQIEHDIEQVNFIFNVSPSILAPISCARHVRSTWALDQFLVSNGEAFHGACLVSLSIFYRGSLVMT